VACLLLYSSAKYFTETSPEYPEYLWYPSVLANASSSSSYLAHKLHRHLATSGSVSDKDLKSYINNELVVPGLGIVDATDEELTAVAQHPIAAQPLLARMISVRAQIGWSSHGHSAVDVNIYSSGGPGTDAIRGNVENTDVGKFLREYIDVDVDAITVELQKKMDRKPKSTHGLVAETASEEQDHWIAHENLEKKLEDKLVELL
jgi:alkaline phosphatase